MAIPTYVGEAHASGTAATSHTVTISTINAGGAPANGDLLIAFISKANVGSTGDSHVNAPAGWHRLGASWNDLSASVFWKIREAGDSNSPAFSSLSAADYSAVVFCIRGADQTRPICRRSVQITSSDTWTWLAETTPVADCLALAIGAVGANRSGISPATGWTERLDLSNTMCLYAQTQDFATSGTSTGTASQLMSGSGNASLTQHMFVLQPPQTATPKDIRVATGSLTSPTSTGNQDITGLGFDCKALIIYGMRTNVSGVVPTDVEYMHGIGADDGVSTASQRCGAMWATSGVSGGTGGFSQIGKIVGAFFSTAVSPSLLAVYSRITDGFRLNWSVVDTSGWDFHYIAFGGSDLAAVCGAKDGSASPLSALPWRPDMAHIVGINATGDTSLTRGGGAAAQMSVGWLDPNTGAAWAASLEASNSAIVRDQSFYTQSQAGAAQYDLQFAQATSSGWSWTGSNTDYFWYLALNWGNATYFPAQVELQRCESTGTPGVSQVFPTIGMGQSLTTKKLSHSVMCRSTTAAGSSAASFSEGHANYKYSVGNQGSFAYGATGLTRKRRRETASAFQGAFNGNLDSPNRIGAWTDRDTVVWATNTSASSAGQHIIGLFTLGFIGQVYTVSASDTVAVTDSIGLLFLRTVANDSVTISDSASRTLTRSRQASDTAAVTDSLARTTTYGRVISDTAVVADSVARTATKIKTASDTAVVTDSAARTLTRSRQASDTVAVTDSVARTATKIKTVSDTAVVTDSLARTATFQRASTDTAVVTDSAARTLTRSRQASDTAVVTDSLARTATHGRVVSDAVVATESVASAPTRSRQISDATAASDSMARTTTYGRRLASDTTVVTDSLARTTTFGRVLSDTAVVTDSAARTLTRSRQASDTAVVTDSLAVGRVLSRQAADTVALVDLTARTALYGRQPNDTLLALDGVLVERAVVIANSVTLSDALAAKVTFGRVISDAPSVVDQVSVVVSLAHTDAIGIADLLSISLRYARSTTDAVTSADRLTTTRSTSISDAASVVDVVARAISLSRAAASDAVTVSDGAQVSIAGAFLLAVADAVDVTDALTRATSTVRLLVDTVTVSEALSQSRAKSLTTSDAIVAADTLASARSLWRTTSDATAVVDALERAHSAARAGSDTVAVADSIAFALNGFKRVALDDVAIVVDSVVFDCIFVRTVSDGVVLADQVSAVTSRGAEVATSDAVVTSDRVARAIAYARAVVDAVTTDDAIEIRQDGIVVELFDAVVAIDSLKKASATAKLLYDVAAAVDALVAQRVLGGSAGDAVAIADHLETDIFSLSADAVMVADAMTRAVSTSRSISDASISEDSVFTGELVFAPHGISGGVNIGPIAMYTVAAAGPLTISHGPDLSTGPVGFVLNLGDYITVTDQLNPGASLTIEFGDSVEAT